MGGGINDKYIEEDFGKRKEGGKEESNVKEGGREEERAVKGEVRGWRRGRGMNDLEREFSRRKLGGRGGGEGRRGGTGRGEGVGMRPDLHLN